MGTMFCRVIDSISELSSLVLAVSPQLGRTEKAEKIGR
jgi:hypothetical protein